MYDPSDLLGANLEARNKKGEIIFALKRKDKYPPMYYIFDKHEDRMDEEEKQNFDTAFALILEAAGALGLPLYDMKEISEGVEAQIKAVTETDEFKEGMKKADEGELAFIKDISFKVFDHATGRINTLTVGVNLKDMKKDVGADNEQGDNQEAE